MPKMIDKNQIKDKIVAMSKRYSVQEIANLLNISPSFVVKVRRERNISPSIPHKSLEISRERQKEIAIEYFINGLTQRALIDKYGLTVSHFATIRKRFESEFGKKKTGIVTKTTPIVREMLINGKSTREIIEATGVTKQYVSEVRQKLEIGK